MRPALLILIGAVATALVAGALLLKSTAPDPGTRSIRVFVAAGIRLPVEEAAAAFTRDSGVRVLLEYGGSGDLESRLMVSGAGDLYIPADGSYTERMRSRGRVRETIPLARQVPVLAVPAGNPKGVKDLADVRARGLRLGAPNPESASLGRVLRTRLGDGWPAFQAALAVTKPTVTEVATDVAAGSLDAAILWDATARMIPGLAALPLPELGGTPETVTAGVLDGSAQPADALAFARFLAAPEAGNPIFAKHGLTPVAGDTWSLRPQVVLFSGAVNRAALIGLLEGFSQREGADISTTFNGCGILCATMDAMQKGGAGRFPDAYYACDICFVAPVQNQFPEAVMLTSTPILIAVPEGNPKGIHGLADLGRPGLAIGICNAEQSTLGYITGKMLETTGLTTAVMANVRSQVPTADLLINQLLTGSLDAAIVYKANTALRPDKLDEVAISNVPAVAIQPFSIWKDTRHRQLMERLLAHLRANHKAFVEKGLEWRGDAEMMPSKDLPVPDYLRKAPREF
jgi:molybdate transport system substrate-binding protein